MPHCIAPMQLVECTKKLTLAYWRNPSYNFMRLLLTLGCALIYGSLYYKVSDASC